MNKAFHNLVTLDKPKGQLTKKNFISLLILTTIVALVATPTAAFASSNVKIGDGPLPSTTVTTPPSNGSSNSTTDPLVTIRMLDKTHGWAMADSSILKTADGGLHWQNVLPANAFGKPTKFSTAGGTFLNDQDAWIAADVGPSPNGKSSPMHTIMVLRTTNGGKSWQSSIIQKTALVSVGTLHFLNTSNGWLQAYSYADVGAPKSSLSLIFHTTDGGQHWNQLASPNQKDIPYPSGISFSDAQNGWETGKASTTNAAQPLLEVTHDGGQTWHSQSLPSLPGAGKSDSVIPRPPVFFGNTGLLPVDVHSPPPSGSTYPAEGGIGLDLYVTHNGGQTWTPTRLITSDGQSLTNIVYTVDVVDSQHAWADLGSNLYATSDGGQSWTQLPQPPQPLGTLDFIDANNGWAISSGWGAISSGVTPGGTKNQLPSLLHTIDGGHTWQPINYFIDGKPITTSLTGGGSTSPTSVIKSKI